MAGFNGCLKSRLAIRRYGPFVIPCPLVCTPPAGRVAWGPRDGGQLPLVIAQGPKEIGLNSNANGSLREGECETDSIPLWSRLNALLFVVCKVLTYVWITLVNLVTTATYTSDRVCRYLWITCIKMPQC